jgi:hypothetical protein
VRAVRQKIIGRPPGAAGNVFGQHDLRAVISPAVEHEVDRGAAAGQWRIATCSTISAAWGHASSGVAVHARRRWPGVAGLEQDAAVDPQAQQVGELTVGVGVARDQKVARFAHGFGVTVASSPITLVVTDLPPGLAAVAHRLPAPVLVDVLGLSTATVCNTASELQTDHARYVAPRT